MLVGHEKTAQLWLSLLRPVLKRRAFGLIAPPGVGRQHFCQEIYLKAHAHKPAMSHSQNTLSDFKQIFSRSKQITVEEIRELVGWFQTEPVQGDFKMLSICPGERLNSEAQNALLKVLEEPPSYLVIVLVAAGKSCFLQPVRSRIHQLNLHLLSQDEAIQIWRGQGIDSSVYEQLWGLAPGQPGLAVERLSAKYPTLYTTLAKTLQQKNPTGVSLLHWQNNLPEDWLQEDHVKFWQWAAVELFKAKAQFTPQVEVFAQLLSRHLAKFSGANTKLMVPAIWSQVL
jgi:hypothetical protein